METFVRGGSLKAILEANAEIDRCLRAGAMAIGAEVVIQTIPGYPRQRNDQRLGLIFGANVVAAEGHAHAADWRINDPQHSYLTPAKLLAMTAVDLLHDDAVPAREILAKFESAMGKAACLDFQRGLFE